MKHALSGVVAVAVMAGLTLSCGRVVASSGSAAVDGGSRDVTAGGGAEASTDAHVGADIGGSEVGGSEIDSGDGATLEVCPKTVTGSCTTDGQTCPGLCGTCICAGGIWACPEPPCSSPCGGPAPGEGDSCGDTCCGASVGMTCTFECGDGGQLSATCEALDAGSSLGGWHMQSACSVQGGGGASGGCDGGTCTSNVPASCAPGGPGMTDCGPGGGGTESCCTSLEVTGGTYDRTYTYGVAGGSDPATVSGFRLDKYLVTVGRFRQFMTAWNGGAGFLPTAGSGKHTHLNQGSGLANVGAGGGYEQGWSATWNGTAYVDPTPARLVCGLGTSLAYTWTPTAGSQESLPINCVTWYEAYAFCIWDGGFLPSEAEWEYAAAGGAEQREYPWGATDPGTSSQYAIYGCHYGPSSCPGLANTAPVGTPALGATLWGQLDMGGNQWEWTLDWYATYVDPCTDCAYLTATSGNQVIRGGSWHAGAADLAPPFRAVENPPTARNNNNGFRCARAP